MRPHLCSCTPCTHAPCKHKRHTLPKTIENIALLFPLTCDSTALPFEGGAGNMLGSPYVPNMFSPVVVRMPSSDEMLGSSSSPPLTINGVHQEWMKHIKDGSLPRDAGVMYSTPRPLQALFNQTTRLGISISYLDTNTKYVQECALLFTFTCATAQQRQERVRMRVCACMISAEATCFHAGGRMKNSVAIQFVSLFFFFNDATALLFFLRSLRNAPPRHLAPPYRPITNVAAATVTTSG